MRRIGDGWSGVGWSAARAFVYMWVAVGTAFLGTLTFCHP